MVAQTAGGRPGGPTARAETAPDRQGFAAVAMWPIDTLGWRRLRAATLWCYGALLVYLTLSGHFPTQRLPLAALIVGGLLLTRLGQGWRRLLQVIVDWAPFTAVLLLYDQTRGVADHLGISLHEGDVLRFENWLFGGTNPSVWLQQHLYDPAHPAVTHWYDAATTLVYTTHFIATPAVAAVLWLRRRRLWMRYITRVILLSFAGLATYILFPEAPPWYASRDGLLPPVARLSSRGWIWLHAGNVDTLLARAQGTGSNPVAAMPSLHTAFATMIALFVGSLLATRWRYLLALYPLAMAFTLVYTGEHYVIDCVAGVLYSLAVHFGVSWWERRSSVQAFVARRSPSARPDDAAVRAA